MKKLFAVIGDPIAHSMSPLMHNDLFEYYGYDGYYHAFQIKEKDLKEAVKGFKAINISGFNVTVPHKVSIMPLLDKIDPLAEAIGAVNTVVNENGQFVGYNTDGQGYVQGLLPIVSSLQNKRILIVGAGGAARAIYFTLAFEGAKKIDITNRTIEKAERLANECPYEVESNIITFDEGEKNLHQYDMIIQTTSIGMAPNIHMSPLSLQNLKKGSIVSDIIYNPLKTKFLQEAKEKGAVIQNGIDMFVYQGALAFEKWTNIFPDVKRMKNLVIQQLGGNEC